MSVQIEDDDTKSSYSLCTLESAKAKDLLQYAKKDLDEYCICHNNREQLDPEQTLLSLRIRNEEKLTSNIVLMAVTGSYPEKETAKQVYSDCRSCKQSYEKIYI